MVLLLLGVVLLLVHVSGYSVGLGRGRRRGWREGWSAGYEVGSQLSDRQLAAARSLGRLEGMDPAESALRLISRPALSVLTTPLQDALEDEAPELPTLGGGWCMDPVDDEPPEAA